MLRRLFTIVPLLFLAGSALLTFLVLLSGATHGGLLTRLYWIQANTDGIDGANYETTRWTNYGICDVQDGSVEGCTKNKAAYPFSPADNFGRSESLPSGFGSLRKTYYYLTRFAFAFWIIGLFFTVVALGHTLGLMCASGRLIRSLTQAATILAFVFITCASALQTAAVVKGHKEFDRAGSNPKYGVKLLAFAWTSTFLLIVSVIGVFGVSGGRSSHGASSNQEKLFRDTRFPDSDDDADRAYAGTAHVVDVAPVENQSKGIKFFKVRSTKPAVSAGPEA